MEDFSVIGTLLFLLTAYGTYMGFRDYSYFEHYKFEVDSILRKKEYKRILTSGFLHVNWVHFIFNIIALTAFSPQIEQSLGYGNYLLIYFGSLIGGNLLALWLHRNHGDYSAVGASGAISGLLFSYILLFPDSSIGFILLPPELSIKSWIFAILFVLISIWGIKKQADNIGHEAHIGGAMIGVLITVLLRPQAAIENWWLLLIILVPFTLFMVLITFNPAVLMIENYWGLPSKKNRQSSTKPKMKISKGANFSSQPQLSKSEELNQLLDKIGEVGIDNLSKKERKRLDELSQ